MIANKKNIRTLVCILGQTRAQNITWENFNKHVLKNLNADLALCVAEKKSYKNKMYENAKYIWKYKDADDYSKHFDNAQKDLLKSKKIKKIPNWRNLIKIKHFWLARIKGTSKIKNNKGIYSSGTGALLIFNRWFLLKRILKNKLINKYDRFVITRSDFVWNIHHPKMENLSPRYIWIPNGEKYGGYTDRHAVLSKLNIYDYLNLIEPILLEPEKLFEIMKSKSNWNLERYIKLYLDQKGYSNKVKFFPYLMYSVRDKKIKTNFRPGRYSYKHKYYIKYFKEYLSSLIMFFFIGGKNKNFKNFNLLYLFYKVFKNLFKIRLILNLFLKNKEISNKFDEKFIKKDLENKIIF